MARKKIKPPTGAAAIPHPVTLPASRLSFRLQALSLAIIMLVLYFNSFYNGYAVDDDWVIVKNEAVGQGVAGIPKIFTSDIYDSYYHQYHAGNQLNGGRYRPLPLVTYAIEQQFIASSWLLVARHVINVLLYILSVVVLLHFLRKVVFPAQPAIAFLAVLLFAIHPVHTEVVANIKSRDEILSLLFITCTFLYSWRFKESKKRLHGLLSVGFFFLALLSKEYAVSLVVLVPLQFYIFKGYSIRKSLATAAPLAGVLVLYLLLRFSVVPLTGEQQEGDVLNEPYALATGAQQPASKIATLFNYVRLLLFPHPLSVDYSYNQLPYKDWSDPLVWLSLAFHLGLITALVVYIKKRQVLAFAIAFYLANLFFVSNFVVNIGAPMGERLIYHASVGFAIGMAWLFYKGYERTRPSKLGNYAWYAALAVIVLLCSVKTITRNADWESNSTLYRKDVLAAGNSAITNGNAGLSYLNDAPLQTNEADRKEMLAKALTYFNKAISIHPGFTFAFINRGTVFFELGDLERAKLDWDTASRQFPGHPDLPGLYASYYINTATSKYGSRGAYNEAIDELKKGAALAPDNLIILYNMGYYYNLAGNKVAAIGAFRKIIELKPGDSLAAKCAQFITILQNSRN